MSNKTNDTFYESQKELEPKFRFEESSHRYYLGDESLPGVTTVLGTLAKPALIQWAANEAVKHFKELMLAQTINGEVLTEADYHVIGEEARTAHTKKRDKAASQGTDVHAVIEAIIKIAIGAGGKVIQSLTSDVPQVQKFIDWAVANDVTFHESEKKLYSAKHKFAGTCDFVCTIDGKKMIGDIKTSNGFYGMEGVLQCSAYRLMIEEMGDSGYVGSVLIRLGKDNSFEELYRYDETGEDKETFLALLKVYKETNKFKKWLENR